MTYGKTLSLFLLVVFASLQSHAQITSTFSADADGWTFIDSGTPVTVNYNSTNGNPGGYVSATYNSNSTVASEGWFAPAKFLGSHAARSYGMNLKFDLQQSFAGTSSSGQGDVRIETTSGFDIVFSLAVKPAVAPAWSSYTIKLDETAGWRVSSTGGALATRADILRALSNITVLEIRGTYITNAANISGLDNVILEQKTLTPSPAITSFTPLAGIPGSNITINGNNFGATPAQNAVLFGTTKAAIVSSTATQLVVTIPKGAKHGPITVINLTNGLLSKTHQSFTPLFDNNKDFGGEIIPASLSRGYNTLLLNGTETTGTSNIRGNIDAGDLDGDGWVDLIATETSTLTIYLFRNLGTGGTVGVSSFANPTTLSIATLPGGSPNGLSELIVTDVDSDGRLDIVALTANVSPGGHLVVFRNTSTSGTISFASPEFFAYAYYSSQLKITSADFDSDGRVDFAFTTGTVPGGIWMSQNLSTPGNINFVYGRAIGTNTGHGGLTVGDLDADGKPELIAAVGSAFEIYQNTSTTGQITFNAPFTVTNTSVTNIGVADLDADSKLDLIWSASGSQYIYFSRNIYSGSVLNASSFEAAFQVANLAGGVEDISVSDINADGKPEVLFSGYSDLGILQNRGSGALSAATFTNTTLFQINTNGTNVQASVPVIADLDGDNKPEVTVIYTGNVVLAEKGIYIFHNESFPAPVINSISPSSGNTAAAVTLTGNFMFTGNVSPSIRLNNISSPVNSPTNTATNTQVPAGAMSGKFAITNHGLTGFSSPFNLTFATDRGINTSSFGPSIDFALSGNVRDAIDVADFDDDGKPEVLAIDNFGTGRIFKNTHATAGQPITTSSLTVESTTYGSGYNLKALDIDGDGKIDLNSGNNLFQNTSSASISFAAGVSTRPTGFIYAVTSDFNKDGKTDFALTDGTALIRVHTNQSSRGAYAPIGKFAPFSEAVVGLTKVNGAGGLVAADFDNDGYDDLIATNTAANSITIYRNEDVSGPITTSSFSLVGNNSVTGNQPYNLTASDFDGDGKIDLAITYFNSAFISIYRNNGSAGTISFASALDITCANKGYTIESQDLDGDGKAEIIVIHQPNPGPGSFTVFQNNSTSGTMSFPTIINYPLTRNPLALSIADINSDQKPDILIVASGGSTAPVNALMVFENKISSGPVITINPQPASTAVCDGANATFTLTATGTTNLVFQWQKFDGSVFNNIANTGGYSGTTTATLTVNTTGNFGAGDYRCKVSGDLATDKFSNTVTLTVNAIPNPPATTGDSDCNSAALTLSASGGVNGQYRWYDVSTGGTAIAGQINSTYVTPVITTTTTYYAALNNGSCESSRTPAIATIAPVAKPTVLFDPPIFNTAPAINLCVGELQKFKAPDGFTAYTWSNGESTQEIIIDQAGTYTVTVEDASGCVSPPSDPLNVFINPFPLANITINGSQLTASTGDSYQWYQDGSLVDGATSNTFDFNIFEHGEYTVAVTDNGCTTMSAPYVYLITASETSSGGWKVYPNPFREGIYIEAPSEDLFHADVIDILGRSAKQFNGNGRQELQMEDLQEGTYFLKIQTNNRQTIYFRIKKTY